MNILITGKPGIGKTTLIKKIINSIPLSKSGFYTGEIREGKERTGFSLTTLDGKESTLASVKTKSPYRVGKYGVNIDSIEKIGVESVREGIMGKGVIIIDEIGKMELHSEKFRGIVLEALNTGRVIATIGKDSSGYIDEIKNRKDVKSLEINSRNRDTLLDEIKKIVSNQTTC